MINEPVQSYFFSVWSHFWFPMVVGVVLLMFANHLNTRLPIREWKRTNLRMIEWICFIVGIGCITISAIYILDTIVSFRPIGRL